MAAITLSKLNKHYGSLFHAVKDVDLYRVLIRNTRPRRKRPSVFTIPKHEKIEPALVSAMMPFDAGFSVVYDSLKTTAEKVGLFSSDEHPPARLAKALLDRGIDYFRAYVCENLGSPDERVTQADTGCDFDFLQRPRPTDEE